MLSSRHPFSVELTMLQPADNVIELTAVFVMLVALSATQGKVSLPVQKIHHLILCHLLDIAVDGMAT